MIITLFFSRKRNLTRNGPMWLDLQVNATQTAWTLTTMFIPTYAQWMPRSFPGLATPGGIFEFLNSKYTGTTTNKQRAAKRAANTMSRIPVAVYMAVWMCCPESRSAQNTWVPSHSYKVKENQGCQVYRFHTKLEQVKCWFFSWGLRQFSTN